MALPVSSLSHVCRALADFVSEGLQASQNNIHVMIGSPVESAPKETDTDHRVNLFFYRLEPGGFGPAAAPGETWWLRLHCLVTAFGVLEDQISAGENDLRLLGEVVRIFHEQPVLSSIATVDGEVVDAQVILQPLSVEEINHLWSTQGDVHYRPSVAYEMALVPVVPQEPAVGGPLARALGLEVRADEAARRAAFAGATAPPPVLAATVDTSREDWAPRICFVHQGVCAESLAFAVGSSELAAFSPEVWVAGEAASTVTLSWEVWDRQEGWRTDLSTTEATAAGPTLDPEEAGSAPTTSAVLPFADRAGQAVLYAVRSYVRGSDGAELEVRSNPLLVTLYEVSS